MSGPINIGSAAEWQSLLADTNVVIADFYADWCGPCKMIAPHFERMAKSYSRPKKMAFAKVNVDTQSTISQTAGVSAMPTFKIYHGGACIETIKGANPSALSEAIDKAAKLADTPGSSKQGAAFTTPGRTLGGQGLAQGPTHVRASSSSWFDLKSALNILVMFVGLYLVSLFSFDAYRAAEDSRFNVHKPKQPKRPAETKTTEAEPGASASSSGRQAAQKPRFRTLQDLGSE